MYQIQKKKKLKSYSENLKGKARKLKEENKIISTSIKKNMKPAVNFMKPRTERDE
jgi:hypothetical protein